MTVLPIPFNNPATYPGHSGVDFPQSRGTIVRASGPGVVGLRNYNPRGGNMVWIDYDGYPGVAYAHLDNYNDSPPVGTRVNEGDIICRVGNSGNSTGPHLHMEVNGHGTTDGFWRFFDRNRVVGGGSSGGQGRGGYQDGSVELGIFQEKLIRMGHDLGPTGADKVLGPKTIAATKHEQSMAAPNGYPGGALDEDGIPGPATNAYLDWWLVGRHTTQGGSTATVANLQSLPNTRGLQKVARLNGYTGALDNDFGAGSQRGLQNFLNSNYGGSLAAWLRSRWGYTDADDIWGPNMAAAATRADTANWNELP